MFRTHSWANIQDSLHYLLCKQNNSRNYLQIFFSFSLKNLNGTLHWPKPSWILMSLASPLALVNLTYLEVFWNAPHSSPLVYNEDHFAIRKFSHQKTDSTRQGYLADLDGAIRLKASHQRVTCDEHALRMELLHGQKNLNMKGLSHLHCMWCTRDSGVLKKDNILRNFFTFSFEKRK